MTRCLNAIVAMVLLAGLAGAAQPGVLYTQDFNTCPATNDPSAGSSSAPNCNASLGNVDWKLWSYQNWAYHVLVRQVEDTGGGDMAVSIHDYASYGWPTRARSLTALAPAVGPWPSWQNVVVSGHVKWTVNAGSDSEFSSGLVLRGDTAVGTSGVNAWTGSFYLLHVRDTAAQDSFRVIRVNGGVETETNLAGTVTWKNGFSDFNAATRRDGCLRVDIQTLGAGGDVQMDAVYSMDPTFKDPSSVIVEGTWTDTATNRIAGGGTVGFAEKMVASATNGTKYYWDRIKVEKKLGGTVVWFK